MGFVPKFAHNLIGQPSVKFLGSCQSVSVLRACLTARNQTTREGIGRLMTIFSGRLWRFDRRSQCVQQNNRWMIVCRAIVQRRWRRPCASGGPADTSWKLFLSRCLVVPAPSPAVARTPFLFLALGWTCDKSRGIRLLCSCSLLSAAVVRLLLAACVADDGDACEAGFASLRRHPRHKLELQIRGHTENIWAGKQGRSGAARDSGGDQA